jgi:biuret amidohydrolase
MRVTNRRDDAALGNERKADMDLGVDKIVPAVIGIDLHRGHLDPAVATMPLEAKRAAALVEANRKFFSAARQCGIPVVHLVTKYRDVAEIRSNPFWRTRADDPKASRKNVERHNLAGLPGTEIMPGLYDPRDFVVDSKKRYDCFVATDLDFMLRRHGINTLLITGINTSSCVLATAIRANVLDYAPVLIEDCVDTMDGPPCTMRRSRVSAPLLDGSCAAIPCSTPSVVAPLNA